MAFGGTFTLMLGTLHAPLRDLCSSVLRAGSRNIFRSAGTVGTFPP